MADTGRGRRLDRAFRLIVAFDRHRTVGITVEEIARELGCCRRTAYRYLEAAVLVLPIRRIDSSPVRYRFMTEEDAA